jgi:hypothetical protein
MSRVARDRTPCDLTGPFRPDGTCIGWLTSIVFRGHPGTAGST